MTLISESSALADFCARQAEAEFITVDTEFIRERTYYPQLCLVQVGGPEEVAAVDTLAPEIDLAPLEALLLDPKILKVFHSARQDMEIFYHLMGRLPAPIFDSQVAAMVCGFGESVAYDTLARKMVGAKLDKASRFADWAHRPLTDRQLSYALADVDHLRPIYSKLKASLSKNGREDWLADEMAILTDTKTYDADPQTVWKRLKTRSSDSRYLAILRALAAWREEEAKRRDVPRGRILRDEQLFDIAAHAPATPEALARSRGLNRDMANGRLGKAILSAVEEGQAVPKADCPKPPERYEAPKGIGPMVDLLRVLLKMKSEEHEVAQRLVAGTTDLEMIAAEREPDIPALKGWRLEIFGKDALDLKQGRLALGINGRQVDLVRVEEP